MKKRLYVSNVKKQCPYQCIYCFVNSENYKQGVRIENLEERPEVGDTYDIIQPACDSEFLLENNWRDILDKLVLLKKTISFATKKNVSCNEVEYLKEANNQLMSANKILNIGVTICRYSGYKTIEPFAPSPEERIEGLKRMYEAGIGCNVIIRPFFPDSDLEDIYKIVEKTKEYCFGYLIGPLYVNEKVRMYLKDVSNGKYLKEIQIRNPEWNQNQSMEVIYADKKMKEIREFINKHGKYVFNNNEECVSKIEKIILNKENKQGSFM